MNNTILKIGAIAAVALVALAAGYLVSAPSSARADANTVTFPPIEQLEHYTTVRRGVTREHMLTSKDALASIKAGQPVPVGTHVVLVDYQSDVLHRYLVSQKMGDGVDDWQYQWFWPNKSIKADENTAQCFSCHRSRQGEQFMFTFSDAVDFDGKAE